MKKPDFRTIAEKRLDSLDLERSRFEKAKRSGTISADRYEILLNAWKLKQERAFKALDREQMFKLPEKKVVVVEKKESAWTRVERGAYRFKSRHPKLFLSMMVLGTAVVYSMFG